MARGGFVYLAEMRIVFSSGRSDAERRMMRRRRGDAARYVGETNPVFQILEAPRAGFTQLCYCLLPLLLSLSGCPVLASPPLRCEVSVEPHSTTGLPLSLSLSLSLSSAALLSFNHLLVSFQQCQDREKTAKVLPVYKLHK